MLGFEVLARPARPFAQFDTQKVARVLKSAVADGAQQFAVAILHGNCGAAFDGALHLQTNPGKGNIL